MWNDSTTVLKCICNTSSRFQPFVANRLSIIHEYTSPDEWRYVNTSSNPADLASRGLMPNKLDQANLWFRGPDFIWQNEDTWPVPFELPVVNKATDLKVKLNKALCASTNTGFGHDENNLLHELLTRYSNWSRLKQAVAWLLRFVLFQKQMFLSEVLVC